MNPEAFAIWRSFSPSTDLGGTSTSTSQFFPQVLRDYDANGLMIYVGIAPRGAATSDALWIIWKIGYTGNNLTSEKTSVPQSIWDNRVALSYS